MLSLLWQFKNQICWIVGTIGLTAIWMAFVYLFRFGEFAVDVTDASGKKAVPAGQEPKWLIDSGNRHFDQQSLDQLEAAIIDSLTRQPGNELPIVFNMGATLPAGQKATAQVSPTLDPLTKALTGYIVNISCAP